MAVIDVGLNLEVKAAAKAMKTFAKSTQNQIKAISSNFSLMGTAAVAAVGAFATGKLLSGIQDVTAAAAIQEDAIKAMNTALALSGEFSEEASKDMQDYAASLQAVTTTGDEAILEQIALAKSFGASNDQAKELVKAALDLSAATGQTLETSVRNLGGTLSGVTGLLSKQVPALKNLTAEQLKSGDAIAIISKQFGGAAESITQTFSGALIQSQNLVGDFQEELGFLVTKNSLVTQSIGLFSKAMTKVISVISDNREAIISFINKGIRALISSIPTLLKGFKFILSGFEGIALASSTVKLAIAELILGILEFSAAETAINGITDVFRALGSTVLAVVSGIIEGLQEIPFASEAFKAMGFDVESVETKLDSLGASLVGSIGKNKTEELKEGMRSFRDAALESGTSIEESFAGVNTGLDFVIETTQQLTDDILKVGDTQVESSNKAIEALNKQAAAQKALSGEAALGPQISADLLKERLVKIKLEEEDQKKALVIEQKAAAEFGKTVTSAATAFTTGAKGANDLIKQGAVAAATAAFGPAGAAAGPIFDLLAQGPEQTRKMIEEFIDAIPVVIDTLVESAPVLIDALAENIDKIIIPLSDPSLWTRVAISVGRSLVTNAIPAFAQSMVEAFNGILSNFKTNMGLASIDIKNSMGVGADYFSEKIKAIGNEFKIFFNLLLEPFQGIIDGFNKVIDKINDTLDIETAVSKGGGKIVEAGKDFISAFGAADGMDVPQGFPNDTFPARLTSGEAVITTSTTDKLNSFIDQQNSQGGAAENLLLQILNALQGGQVVNASIEMDGQVLADAILNLNRQNARLA